ncbi:hypothetical protein [Winogradskyella sediminis]|uniref:Uncharacterized protein n=1 Tax=Winogradskyella sediminis TaxID=1382466 RepID=A0A1H1VCK1_9FLAO|nr:hypothetical protein [Winogradskyella sediminis]SDS82161.1 hypothetical protein SAMN04489797_2504 [Winogradskyella sediminis]
MKQTEISIGVGILVVMLLRLFITVPYASLLITMLTLALSMLYFVFSFGLLNRIRLRHLFNKESYKGISLIRIIGTIGTGFVLSLLSISILFKYQLWPYGSILLLIGLMSILPIIVVTVFKFISHKNRFHSTLLMRLSIISMVGLLFFITKSETLLEMRFRNFPDYIEAEKKAMKDPENLELQRISNEERLKMESH